MYEHILNCGLCYFSEDKSWTIYVTMTVINSSTQLAVSHDAETFRMILLVIWSQIADNRKSITTLT